jgi:hypothetical protein
VTFAQFGPREQLHSPEARTMAAVTLASSVVVRGTPVASVAARKRSYARPNRGSAFVVRAGEIAGLTECGKFQELCRAEIPAKIPRCVSRDTREMPRDRDGRTSHAVVSRPRRARAHLRASLPPTPIVRYFLRHLSFRS